MTIEQRFEKFINIDFNLTTIENRKNLVLSFKEELKDILINLKENTYIYYVIINYFNSKIALFIYKNTLNNLSLTDLEKYWKLEDFNRVHNENKRTIKLYRNKINNDVAKNVMKMV